MGSVRGPLVRLVLDRVRPPKSEGDVEAPPLLDGFALARISAQRSLWRGLVAGAYAVLPP